MRRHGGRQGAAALVGAAVAVAVALAAGGAGATAATLPGTVIARAAITPASTDGAGTIALMERPGVIRTIDAASGTVTDTDVSSPCSEPSDGFVAVGAGRVLYYCRQPKVPSDPTSVEDQPRLLDLATRITSAVVGGTALQDAWDGSDNGSLSFTGVGSVGVGFSAFAGHGDAFGALDLRTGVEVPDPQVPRKVIDLDAPGLVTTLCAPLARGSEPARDGREFTQLQYEPPYALYPNAPAGPTLRRCGSAHATVLAPPRRWSNQPPADAQLSAGFVSWFALAPGDQPLIVYQPACDVRLRWLVSQSTSVAHLPAEIVVSEAFSGGDPTWRVRRISLAGSCERVTAAARLSASSDGRSVSAAARSGTVADAPTGATATLPAPRHAASRLALRAGHRLALSLGAPARSLRWRLGDETWRHAVGGGTSWRLRVPDSPAPRVLMLAVRFAAGGSARFALHVPRTEG